MSHKVEAGTLSVVAILTFDPENSADVNRVKNLDQDQRQNLMRDLDYIQKMFRGSQQSADLNEKGAFALVCSDDRSLEEWSLLKTICNIVGNIFLGRTSSSSVIEKLAIVQSVLKEHRFADEEFNLQITAFKNAKNVTARPAYKKFVAETMTARIEDLTKQHNSLNSEMNKQEALKEKLLHLEQELKKISTNGCNRENVREIKKIIMLIAREKIRNSLLRKKMHILESALESLKFNENGEAITVQKRIKHTIRRENTSMPVTGIINFVNSYFIIGSIEESVNNCDKEMADLNEQITQISTEIQTLQKNHGKFNGE